MLSINLCLSNDSHLCRVCFRGGRFLDNGLGLHSLAECAHLGNDVVVVDLPPGLEVLGRVHVGFVAGHRLARHLVKGCVPRLGHADKVNNLDVVTVPVDDRFLQITFYIC